MRRREFITVLGGAAAAACTWPFAALAQAPAKRPRITFLGGSEPRPSAKLADAFIEGMRVLNYTEGRDFEMEYRWAQGYLERLPALAEELVRRGADMIVVGNVQSAVALRDATETIPIVSAMLDDPVGLGLIKSDAKPSGNVTGLLASLPGLPTKQLELVRDWVPGATRIGLLVNPTNVSDLSQRQEMETAGAAMGVTLIPVETRAPEDLDPVFHALARERVDFVIVLRDPLFFTRRRTIAAAALATRLPTIYAFREPVDDGGLISYGINMSQNFRRAADYVVKILKGGDASSLRSSAVHQLHGRSPRAQQPALPVIGFLHSQSPDAFRDPLRGFRQGLKEAGYVEGENVAIEYRFADNQMDQLSELAADLVRRRVAVIVTGGGPAPTFAAKSATATIPIMFAAIADDPVKLGLVASLARPGGNVTGTGFLLTELATKRLELLREMVPAITHVEALVNSAEASNTEATLKDLETAARLMGLEITALKASTSGEINAAFAALEAERPGAIFVAPDAFFVTRRVQLALLAMLHRIPVTYAIRPFAEAGGLMSYGASLTDAYRQTGGYTGRILKGAKPADLPVVQASKFELVINASTARMLGLTVPDKLLVAADEVIE